MPPNCRGWLCCSGLRAVSALDTGNREAQGFSILMVAVPRCLRHHEVTRMPRCSNLFRGVMSCGRRPVLPVQPRDNQWH